jgi:hypothetical protein
MKMKLDEALATLNKAGFITENAISFEQEAKNIVYSYGLDEYGLDVDQIVKIMQEASKFKEPDAHITYVTKQFKEIAGLSIWDIEKDEKLMAAHFDICNAIYKNNRNRK